MKNRKDRIRELETEFRILDSEFYITGSKRNYHARDNRRVVRAVKILEELERISLKWKVKKLLGG